ncbi:MAG: Glycosyl transferase family 2 [Candidatus Woesebacteria bacterium GW2011_GWA1_41_7]|uniref:Glycosyl transferase family 2 n=1 Tax=Candidatus Woesebacteria bacterium GW2011_GWA1_41_7 TaxID=1618556 RepID=A0A0G0Z3I6_9BACT|nr:MAG: Glycosyl transferase family 2 [Candidatus Woesebacteria bacterium GW2011_GWA1_41_7]
MEKVVIVMPAWNEVENIKSMVEVLTQDEFPKIGADMQLLIVDNHSTDGTAEAAEDASKKYNNVHIIQQKNSGLGWAYVSGMQYAIDELKADAILEMDADFQHPPRFVKPMVEAYLSGAEYVIGSRYIEGGSVPKEWAASRKAISFFGNLFIRTVLLNFKIHDLTTGFRLSKVRGVLDKIELVKLRDLDKFAYKVDLLYQSLKNSKKTVEVPLEFASRTKDKSKFNWKEMVATFKLAIILGIKDKQRFIKFGVVGFTGFLVNYLGLEFLKRMGLTTYWAVIVQPLVVNGATTLFGDTSLIRLAGLLFALFLVVVPYNYIVYNLFIWRTWKIPKFFKRD